MGNIPTVKLFSALTRSRILTLSALLHTNNGPADFIVLAPKGKSKKLSEYEENP